MYEHRMLRSVFGLIGTNTGETSVHKGTNMMFPVALVAFVSILGFACSNASTAPTSGSPAVPKQVLAPNFSFNLYQGEDIVGSGTNQLAQLKGTPVVLNFWARLCPPCWTEMPDLQEFSEEFEGEILLLGIDIGQFTGLGTPRDASKLLDAMGITYPAGFTDDRAVVEQYEVLAMPSTVFIDRHGGIFKKWTGALDREIVTTLAKTMLTRDTN